LKFCIQLKTTVMKKIITLLFIISSFRANAQTPLCQVFHGCGGATVVAYPGDPLWSNVTYEFQRQTGITWTTVHTSTNNWHIVIPGDVTVATAYRTLVRNNVTSDERFSNGVTVNPALFFNTVLPPNPLVTMYWGGDNTGGVNYAEILPHPFGADSRPPYTFEYKKTTDVTWQNKIATTGVFVFPLDANAQYQFRVTNVCGQTSNISEAGLSSVATAVFNPAATNCSGGTIQVGALGNGQDFAQRAPFTFGYALLPPGTATTPVPEAILNSIVYSYPAGNITGLAHGQYVVRGRDRFGVLTNYALATVNINPAPPFGVTFGVSNGYCQFYALIQSNPHLKGIRPAGSAQPYVFSTGLQFSNLQGGQTYETVLQDICGRISNVTLLPVPAAAPQIIVNWVSISNCKYVITVNANVCSSPEYGIQPSGSPTITWQTSNVFGNLPLMEACHTIFVKDINSGFITQQQVCTDGIIANTIQDRDNPDCISNYYVEITPVSGVPPYTYSISYDGINFPSTTTSNTFSNLRPGTYTIRATDACGLSMASSVDSSVELGSVFYLKQSGVNSNCTNSDTLGGFLQFGLRLFKDDDILSPPPYHFSIKEITSINGNEVQYGITVYSGQSPDTIITIKGLEGNKNYGFFVSNACGQSFTSANREPNTFFIPAFSSPTPDVNIDMPNCNGAFITVGNLPNGAQVKIFSGQDTTGTLQPMVNSSTSAVLAGGFYTVKINTANYNGCYWEKVYSRFINTDDSTRAGQFDQTVSSGLCAGISNTVSLYNHIINETPGGEWSSTPDLNWSNQFAGEFIPADQAVAIYNITYEVTSYCGINNTVNFQVSTDLGYCNLIYQPGDYESAMTPSGCKTYIGDVWQHVFNSSGNLGYSINAGNGNTIQSACWGVRVAPSFGNPPPRSTVINGTTVYFADRNFYIEPSGTTIANPPVRIRLYYSADEIIHLLNYLHTHGFPAATVNSLRILKKKAGPGSPVNLDIAYDPGASSSLYSIITPVVVPFGFSGYYFEFELTGFSELALVFSNSVTLPVTWLYINGQLQNNAALIKWATASESNTQKFEVEHSSNGTSYSKIGSVTAAGNSSSTQHYQFLHGSPAVGKNYYRIKQIDLDGRFTYSSIILLQHKDSKTNIIIAPNPVQNNATIFFNETGSKTLQLLTTTGHIVYTEKINGTNNRHTINMSKLASGIYLLRLHTANGIELHKIIKQ
jgi:Secretion system C-terminal sorting domain